MSPREQSGLAANRQVTIRPTPKLVPFLVSGVVIAAVAAVVVVLTTEPAEDYTTAASIGYMTFVFCLPALSLSALAWLITERRSRRRTRTYDAVASPAPAAAEDDASSTAPTERTPENGPR